MKDLKNIPAEKDRTKIKSTLFFISNIFRNNLGVLKHAEGTPFCTTLFDKICIFSNNVIFYKNGIAIDEIKNINMDTNKELISTIENRINTL